MSPKKISAIITLILGFVQIVWSIVNVFIVRSLSMEYLRYVMYIGKIPGILFFLSAVATCGLVLFMEDKKEDEKN